jgi:hypothetical protein
MHKKMLALSRLCRERGDPPAARRAIGRAQCNDAYWHGVFGGLYLPHLRAAIWRELARAEGELRRGEPLAWEECDLDHDGAAELWIYSAAFSALVSPARGAALEELTQFNEPGNYADTLTRRPEAYHEPTSPTSPTPPTPPTDPEPRALLQERVWAPGVTLEQIASGAATPLRSWSVEPASWEQRQEADALIFRFDLPGLVKTLRFHGDGSLEATFAWELDPAWPEGAWFTTELSLARPLALEAFRAIEWRYPIETVAKSEQGLERTVQGESLTLAWPAASAAARVTLLGGPR